MEQLRNLIKSKDYSSRFENIEQIVGNIAGKTRIFFPKYTNHGVDHLKNVERHANNIIPENMKKKLSEEEIFCLLCGIWLHDIGMVPIDEEIEVYEKKSKEDRNKYRNNIREMHHIRSENYIKKNYEELGLNKLEAKIIGKIAKCHRKTKLNEMENVMYNGKSIDIAVLGAIVRLSDECDVSKDRESSLSSEGIDEDILEEHYSIHDLVNDVWIDHESQTIYLSCIVENEKELKPIKKRQKEIQEKLDQTNNYLRKLEINLKFVKLDKHDDTIYEREIICKLANNDFNIEKWGIKSISHAKIQEILCNLKAESLFNSDEYSLGFKNTFFAYKKLFAKFIGHYNLKNFYFTKYSQEMIEKCFNEIEKKFNAYFPNDRKNRIEILKNAPTAFYLFIIFEELIGDNKFKLNYNKNGDLIIDFLLLMSIFNDTYYFNDQIDFKTVKEHINELINDKRDLQLKIHKNKENIPTIQPKDETNNAIPFTIRFNPHDGFEDYIDLTPTSDNAIKILGDRIKYIEIGEDENYKKYRPDMIILSKPKGLELKIDNKPYKLKFKKEKLSKNSILFTSESSEELDLILKLKFEFNFDKNNHKISLSILPKSNKIEDVLYQIQFEKKCSEKDFEILFDDETVFKNTFPETIVDDEFVKFLEKVNEINNYFDLNIIYDDDYEINSRDIQNTQSLCSYIKNGVIYAEDIRAKFKITTSQLEKIIKNEHEKIEVNEPNYRLKLLNKNIELGSFKIKINSLKIINKEELKQIVKSNNSEDYVGVEIIMADEESKVILEFNKDKSNNVV